MKLNINFDVVILKNGKRISRIKQHATKGDAITCADICAGPILLFSEIGFCNG